MFKRVGIILGIYAATKSAFAGLGESCQGWLQRPVAMGADGAAVNLGRKGSISEAPRGGGKAHHPISLHAS